MTDVPLSQLASAADDDRRRCRGQRRALAGLAAGRAAAGRRRVLLLGGRRTDRWGHWLGVAMPALAFVLGAAQFIALLGRDAEDRARRAAPATPGSRSAASRSTSACCSTSCRCASCC